VYSTIEPGTATFINEVRRSRAMKLQCPVCRYWIEIHRPREGKVIQCEECKTELRLIEGEKWELTVFEREKEERFL